VGLGEVVGEDVPEELMVTSAQLKNSIISSIFQDAPIHEE
jgi:hypothetical protein